MPIRTIIEFKSSIRTVNHHQSKREKKIKFRFVKDVFDFNLVNVANVTDSYYTPIVLQYFVNQVILLLPNVVQHIKYKSTINTDNSFENSVPMFFNIHEVNHFLLEENKQCSFPFLGVCVDNMGHIIVVECKVMRVFIFDMNGNVLNKFTCSKYLEFPNGVCCNDKQEIFISDNRAHCIKVFSYDGQFLRTIGSEGVTNYPIGVVQNSQGDVLIADNHNNFNLTIFNQGKREEK